MLINRIGTLLQQFRQINPGRTAATLARHEKLLDKYRKYAVEDGTPVYLKGGFVDKMLFQMTVMLCILGFLDGGTTLYGMSKPKKK